MSSRPKALLKHSKAKHKKEQKLETADDFQAAGVDFEDAAGKWRAGDAAKSMRFFHRALEVYEQGLQKFPRTFDLAYNKARVQLEIATHPILVKQLQQPVLSLLQVSLESHHYALNLSQDNADLLFNTSQVLTCIAEEIAKSESHDDTDAIKCLEEALELQNRCLSLQELRFEENVEQQKQPTQDETARDNTIEGEGEDDEDGGMALETSQQAEEQWFSIVEPVTENVLVDTALAQLGTLTTLCGILSNSPAIAPQAMLAWIEEYSSRILSKKLPFFVKGSRERLSEITLVKANFVSALLEAGFRAGKLDAATYKRERDSVFSAPELELDNSVDGLLSNARSLMSFNAALVEVDTNGTTGAPTSRWNALSAAAVSLATASKIKDLAAEDLAKTHLLRGDCSLLQRQMGLPPTQFQTAVSNGPQLLKNAEVFYRNASKLSLTEEERSIGGFRSAVTQYLQQGDKSLLRSAVGSQAESWVSEQIEDMILDGLLPTGFQVI